MKKLFFILLFFTLILGFSFVNNGKTVMANAKKTYTVTPAKISKMAQKNHKTYYNKYTKCWFGFNDYLKLLEKSGGGKLVIKKGTYNISNAIYVPSNVTIEFKDKVTFNKISTTGKAGIKASSSMWQLCPYSKHNKKNSIGKYNGCKNVKFIAKGKVTFNMKNVSGMCVVIAHANDVEISGITFKGMNGNHYVEVNGSKNVTIAECTFNKAKSGTLTKYYNKEAINIDLPDKTTKGLPLSWPKHDKTPCNTITIKNNIFDGMTRGVGSHKFSQNSSGENIYHNGILIENNIFKNIYDNGVFVLNWQDAIIRKNIFYNIGKSDKAYSSGSHGISGGGINGITITDNSFEKTSRNAIYFVQQQNIGSGSQYKKVSVNITSEQVRMMLTNTVKNCGNDANENYAGYDVLFFRNDSSKSKINGVGIDLKIKRVYDSEDGLPRNKERYDEEYDEVNDNENETPYTEEESDFSEFGTTR